MAKEHPFRRWRRTEKLAQGAVAKRLKISQSYLCEIEKWNKEPALTLANRLCAMTGGVVDLSDFLIKKAA